MGVTTRELRQEIRRMIKKDSKVKDYITYYEAFSGLKYSGRLTVEQLNDIINWCVNEQLTEERNQRNSIGGILC